MKRNIFFLMLAIFCVTLPLEAGWLGNKKKIGDSAGKNDEKKDDEKIEIAPGLSIYKELEKNNDFKNIKAGIKEVLLTSDHLAIMGMISAIAERDPENAYTLVNPDCITQYLIRAVIDGKTEICKILETVPFLKNNKLWLIDQIRSVRLTTELQDFYKEKPIYLIKELIEIWFLDDELKIVSDGDIIHLLPVRRGDQLVVVGYPTKKVELSIYNHQTKTVTKWVTIR